MTQELITKVEDGLKAFEAFKTDLLPKLDKLDAIDQAALAKMEKSIGDAVEANQQALARQKAADDEIAALKTAFNRPAASAGTDETALKLKFKNAVNAFARENTGQSRGSQLYFDDFINEKHAGDLELKALSVGSQPDGGYLVMPEFGGIIQTKVYETSPMRQLATVQSIGGLSLEYVIDNDEATAGWTGETSTRSETNTPTLGMLTITAHEMYAKPRATQTLLDDAKIDMESWLSGKIGEQFGRKEATAFVTGTGVAQPRGIMSYTAGTNIAAEQVEQVNSGSASTFTYDGLINLQNALKEPYQVNASFLFRRASMAPLLLIKDGEGRPIFNMDYTKNGGSPATLLGAPAYFAADVAAVGSNALAMAYGDFKQAYVIADRIGFRLLRDPYSSKPYVEFYATKRVGGQVVNFEAIKLQKISS